MVHEENAILEHYPGIPEHRVHHSGNLAVSVELEVVPSEERVLESLDLAAIEH